jgi:hypothetical protein
MVNAVIFSVQQPSHDLTHHHSCIRWLKDRQIPYSVVILSTEVAEPALLLDLQYLELAELLCERYGRQWYITINVDGFASRTVMGVGRGFLGATLAQPKEDCRGKWWLYEQSENLFYAFIE